MKRIISTLLTTLLVSFVYAQSASIQNFIIKEHLLKNSKLAIIAADSLNNPNEAIQGDYAFSVSGFSQTLKFNDGVAVLALPIEKSTFVYIKHTNDLGSHSKLAYIYKKENNLTPFVVSGWWLIAIPIILIVLSFLFRKFLIFAIIIFLCYVYFSYSNGISMGTFFETFFDSLKGLF